MLSLTEETIAAAISMQLLGEELHLEITLVAECSSLQFSLNTSKGNHGQSTPCNVSREPWETTTDTILGLVKPYLQTYLWQMIRRQC